MHDQLSAFRAAVASARSLHFSPCFLFFCTQFSSSSLAYIHLFECCCCCCCCCFLISARLVASPILSYGFLLLFFCFEFLVQGKLLQAGTQLSPSQCYHQRRLQAKRPFQTISLLGWITRTPETKMAKQQQQQHQQQNGGREGGGVAAGQRH